ncbi:hypothetical protein BBP40_011817 [Aspergillus hancockii]|nr:hypothetical protein BBP40_011817 [Aspergillus hancockii]
MDTEVAIILVGVFGVLTEILMLLRLLMRKLRGQSLTLSDHLTIACIGLVLARSAFATVVILWGNNHMHRPAGALSSTEIYHRQVGSRITMVNRLTYNVYLWLQKAIVLLLCQRILSGLPWPERIIKACWGFLFLSFAAVQITTFVDCSPLRLYWQVLPDPAVNNQRKMHQSSHPTDNPRRLEHNHRHNVNAPPNALAPPRQNFLDTVHSPPPNPICI